MPENRINRVVLFPEKHYARLPGTMGLGFRQKTTINQGQPLACWLIEPAPATGDASLAARPPTVLINHSNRGNMSEGLDHAALFSRLGCWTVSYDYQGFGDSGGKPNVSTLASDARAVLDAIDEWSEPVASVGCVVVGLSLGTLVAVALANQCPERIAGLILEGTIDPHAELREKFGALGAPVAEVVCSQIPQELTTSRSISNVRCPTLFVHAGKDAVATPAFARKLFDAATCPKQLWLAEDGQHLELIRTHSAEYERRVRSFLRTVVGAPERTSGPD